MLRSLIIAVAMVAGAVVPATAQDAPEGWSVGIGALSTSSPYVGEDVQTRVLPSLTYRNGPFSIGATGLSYSVLDQGNARFDLVLAPRFSTLDDPDSPALDGIDRDFTLDAGLRYTLSLPSGTGLRASLLQEITGEHEGQEFDLRATQSLGSFGVPVSFYAGASWRSAGLSDYLYGVFPSEAAPGRPAYSTGDTITPYIGVSGFIPLSENWAVIGRMQADFLGGDITDSPIVEDDTVISATVGVGFRF
jgi:outer membrane protein